MYFKITFFSLLPQYNYVMEIKIKKKTKFKTSNFTLGVDTRTEVKKIKKYKTFSCLRNSFIELPKTTCI